MRLYKRRAKKQTAAGTDTSVEDVWPGIGPCPQGVWPSGGSAWLSPSCQGTPLDPLHLRYPGLGLAGGEWVRRSLNTRRDWAAAAAIVHGWEASGQIGVIKVDVPTVEQAADSTLPGVPTIP